jgi:MFS family permease
MGALAFAIVEGPEWGWTDSRVIAAFVAVAAMVPAVVFRSGRHPVPAVELSLFRVRSFAVANVVMLFYAAAFFSTLLGSILYLTTVWHYSVLRAGLAFTPGPLTVVVVSAVAGRLVSRVGFRPLIALGSTLGAVALMRFATQTGTEPDYLRVWLPSNILLGMGVGLSFAIISAAAVSGLAPSRFGVASGINQTARQVGGVIGVAVLIAIVGTPATREIAMDRLHIVFATSAVLMVGAGITSLALGGRRVAVAPEVPAGRAVTAAPATPGWMPE